MAGLLARGSVQLAAFPTCRLGTEISGIGQALAAYSCGGSRGLVSKHPAVFDAYHIPSSLSRSREAIKGTSTTLRPRIVNGNSMHYPERVVRCLVPTAWGWRVKRESGASASLAFNSGTAPATVSESRRILWSLRGGVGRHSSGQRHSRVRRPA